MIQGLMRQAMVNPKIGTMVDYAVQHGVSPSVYAPLIARSIVAPMEDTQASTDNNEQ
jgi:hypothetical protein